MGLELPGGKRRLAVNFGKQRHLDRSISVSVSSFDIKHRLTRIERRPCRIPSLSYRGVSNFLSSPKALYQANIKEPAHPEAGVSTFPTRACRHFAWRNAKA